VLGEKSTEGTGNGNLD